MLQSVRSEHNLRNALEKGLRAAGAGRNSRKLAFGEVWINVRHLYEKRDRLGSRVSLTRIDYHDQTNTVKPTIDITAGEAVAIRATGAKISSRKLKELVPIFQERSIDADLLVEGERNIAQYLESRGYFEAQVTYRIEERAAGHLERIITYQISPGARHNLYIWR